MISSTACFFQHIYLNLLLECMQIDLITATKTLITFSPNTSPGVNKLFMDGHAYVSHGPLILIIDSYSTSYSTISGIHIFNTATRQWTLNPNILFPWGSFTWGIIGNHLYIVDGIDLVGTMKATKVYDLETRNTRWVIKKPLSWKKMEAQDVQEKTKKGFEYFSIVSLWSSDLVTAKSCMCWA